MVKSYKDTLFISSETVPMRANLVLLEKQIQKFWADNKIIDKLLDCQENGQIAFIDGPPYANGSIHLGHVLNKLLKDFLVRFHAYQKNLAGPLICGWDTHGLPIEWQIVKKWKLDNFLSIRRHCRKYAAEQIANQKAEFNRLGLCTNLDVYYHTDQQDYQLLQWEVFFKMHEKGYIYRAKKPVFWSWKAQTALADAEVEYKTITDIALYVLFPVVNYDNLYFVVYTTTPWTLPANKGLAFTTMHQYAIFKDCATTKKYILLKTLSGKIEKLSSKKFEFIKDLSANEVAGMQYYDLFDKSLKKHLYHGEFVSESEGTGIVHLAPGHGHDDFIVAVNKNLQIDSCLDENGHFTSANLPNHLYVKKYDNLFYCKVNKAIIFDLQHEDLVFYVGEIKHSYPHDWRTKKPVILRATNQWFIDIKKLFVALEKEANKPEYKCQPLVDHLKKTIKNRSSWCISRQRAWGVPIPLILDQNYHVVNTHKINSTIIDYFRKHPFDEWWEENILEKILKKQFKKNYHIVTDIMDVWFDSGCAPLWLIQKLSLTNKQFTYFLEGNDQFRGWFNSSTMISLFMNQKLPFKFLISHGFVLDGAGQKMSKSLGNVIEPSKIINQYGVDVIRLVLFISKSSRDVNVDNNSFKQGSILYRKWRNFARYLLANINSFRYTKTLTELPKYSYDYYMLQQLKQLHQEFCNIFSNQGENGLFANFHEFGSKLSEYITWFSRNYGDFAKDILYIQHPSSSRAQSVRFVFEQHLRCLLHYFYIVIPHTGEEIYQKWNIANKQKSLSLAFNLVQIEKMKFLISNEEITVWEQIFAFKTKLFNYIEKNYFKDKKITAIEQLSISLPNNFKNIYQTLPNTDANELALFFGVSNLQISTTNNFNVTIFNGKKCERCWRYFSNNLFFDKVNMCTTCKKVVDRNLIFKD